MATSLNQEGTTHHPNTSSRHHPPNSPRAYFIITLSRPRPNPPRKIQIRIPKALVKAMHRGGARSHRSEMEGTPKGGSMMAGFFRKKKLQFQDEHSYMNDVVPPSDAIQSSKPHLALSVPRNKFPVQGIGHVFARKVRLFRKVTWGKLSKKPVFRHPNLFRNDPGTKHLKSKVKKNECTDIVVVPNRGIQRFRRILKGQQGQGASARKSFCQPESEMDDCDDDRKDGELELCKKRILIGYKCRPLGRSGTLRYDQNGILSPELFP